MGTGMEYRADADPGYYREMVDELLNLGCGGVMLTGFHPLRGRIGLLGKRRSGEFFSCSATEGPRSCHGTGDIFAAVFTGALLREKDLCESAVLAADFVRKCVENTPESTPHGVEFEQMLPWLWEQL